MKYAENQNRQSRSRQSWFRKARKIRCLGIVVAVLASGVIAGRPAYAGNGNGQGNNNNNQGNNGQGSGTSVPEIDPGAALSALTLLGGGALLLSDRRRRKASSH